MDVSARDAVDSQGFDSESSRQGDNSDFIFHGVSVLLSQKFLSNYITSSHPGVGSVNFLPMLEALAGDVGLMLSAW